MLHACNPYANIYQTTTERLQDGAIELNLRLVNDHHIDLRRYHAPTANEVGTLMVGGDVDEVDAWDIVVRLTNGYFQRVSPLHCRTPTLAKCGGEAQHLEKSGVGVLRYSQMFKARQQGAKHLVLACSWCH
jgi:hypothetical protein